MKNLQLLVSTTRSTYSIDRKSKKNDNINLLEHISSKNFRTYIMVTGKESGKNPLWVPDGLSILQSNLHAFQEKIKTDLGLEFDQYQKFLIYLLTFFLHFYAGFYQHRL